MQFEVRDLVRRFALLRCVSGFQSYLLLFLSDSGEIPCKTSAVECCDFRGNGAGKAVRLRW